MIRFRQLIRAETLGIDVAVRCPVRDSKGGHCSGAGPQSIGPETRAIGHLDVRSLSDASHANSLVTPAGKTCRSVQLARNDDGEFGARSYVCQRPAETTITSPAVEDECASCHFRRSSRSRVGAKASLLASPTMPQARDCVDNLARDGVQYGLPPDRGPARHPRSFNGNFVVVASPTAHDAPSGRRPLTLDGGASCTR
jgi:hypothetical protein